MKQKHWEGSVFDKTSETIRDDTFYTTDTEAYLIFELIDEDFTPDSATVTVYNIYGKATINAKVEIVDGIVQYEMPVEAIGHPGGWRTQVIYTKDNEDYTTKIIEFDVGGHLLDNKKPAIVDIENWNSFITHAGELIDDWEQLEEIRQANEQQRELAESARQTEFETNETSRQTSELVREEAEGNRQSTFEANEAGRQSEFEENELDRESAESERVSNEEERELNEEERISKDSDRDSKIEEVNERLEENEEDLAQHKIEYAEDKGTFQAKLDSKSNKYMLLSPKYDLVYDSCVRDVDTPLDAFSVPMESGHYLENAEDRETDVRLTYEPDGVLLATPASRRDFSPVLVKDFNVDFPYFDVRANNTYTPYDRRYWFVKYEDKDNWVVVMINSYDQKLKVVTSVEGIRTDIATESTGGTVGERQADAATIYSLKAEIIEVHRNFAETKRALRVFKNGQRVFTVPIPTNAVDFPNRVGFTVDSRTEILNFRAGRSR